MPIRVKDRHGNAAAAGDALAIEIVGFLVGDSERLERFLAITGLGPGDLRTAAMRPEFSRSMLDYLMSDEELIKSFASSTGRKPEAVALTARRALPPDYEP